jgi:hypothetical protein
MQFSKRALRTYHLPDEEQKQIQMITAILLHLVQFSATVPESLNSPILSWSTLVDATVDPSYPVKCLTAVTEASCQFWTGVLQRVTGSKTQDLSEAKGILENIVADLLVTLNLPEYPASAPILEVITNNTFHQTITAIFDERARSVGIRDKSLPLSLERDVAPGSPLLYSYHIGLMDDTNWL